MWHSPVPQGRMVLVHREFRAGALYNRSLLHTRHMNDDEYYRIRESGTGFRAVDGSSFSVTIAIGEAACRSAIGQSLALNLINMVVRFVNKITIVLGTDQSDLLVRFPYEGTDLRDTISCVATHCDPRASVVLIDQTTSAVSDRFSGYSIGIGSDIAQSCDLYLSADGYIGNASTKPLADPVSSRTLVGAGVASLLGAANVARRISALEPLTICLSGWNLTAGEAAVQGPVEWTPLDVGTVRMIGAGAVAGALAYWLYQWGVSGTWQIVDADVVRLKNVPKTLVFATTDAAEITPPGLQKVQVLGRFLSNSSSVDAWYDAWDRSCVHSPDVILPLANERGVRARIASESATVVLHATTSSLWQSTVHRHIAGRDDCIACRFSDETPVSFKCSTGSIADPESPTGTRDESLPFVAGGSGLLLAVMLKHLQLEEVASIPWNYCTWHWRTESRFTSTGTYSCAPGCAMHLPTEVRRIANAK